MSIKQRITAQVTLAVVIVALLWPPWQYREPDAFGDVHSNDAVRGLHFSFVASVPYEEAYLIMAVLGVEVGLVVATMLLVIFALGKPLPSKAD